jgi:hypothetical protein
MLAKAASILLMGLLGRECRGVSGVGVGRSLVLELNVGAFGLLSLG